MESAKNHSSIRSIGYGTLFAGDPILDINTIVIHDIHYISKSRRTKSGNTIPKPENYNRVLLARRLIIL
jgi:hypothetical protein